MKNVVLFIAHFINDDTLCRYRKLRDELECEKYDVVWVYTAVIGLWSMMQCSQENGIR